MACPVVTVIYRAKICQPITVVIIVGLLPYFCLFLSICCIVVVCICISDNFDNNLYFNMTEHIKIKRFDTKYGNNNLILFSSPSLTKATNNLLNVSSNSSGSSGSSRKSSHGVGGVIDDGNKIENLISNEQKLKLEKLKWHDNNIKLMSKSSSTSTLKKSKLAASNNSTTNNKINNSKMIVKEKENHSNASYDSGRSRFQRSHSTNIIHNNNSNQANNNKVKLFVHTVETVVERNKKATEWLHQEQNDVSDE